MYEITIADIKAYLSTVGPNDFVGMPGVCYDCLVSHALKHKYNKQFCVSPTVFWVHETPITAGSENLSQEVAGIVQAFDAIPVSQFNKDVSRKMVEQFIPVLGEN